MCVRERESSRERERERARASKGARERARKRPGEGREAGDERQAAILKAIITSHIRESRYFANILPPSTANSLSIGIVTGMTEREPDSMRVGLPWVTISMKACASASSHISADSHSFPLRPVCMFVSECVCLCVCVCARVYTHGAQAHNITSRAFDKPSPPAARRPPLKERFLSQSQELVCGFEPFVSAAHATSAIFQEQSEKE